MLEAGIFSRIILFTDESQVLQSAKTGGIWCERGKGIAVSGAFYACKPHDVGVMVWGGIVKTGYRTQLVRCPKSVNGTTYRQILDEIKGIPGLKQVFKAKGFVWEQDNVPAHKPSRSYLPMQMDVLL
jgi:hypothetical protein